MKNFYNTVLKSKYYPMQCFGNMPTSKYLTALSILSNNGALKEERNQSKRQFLHGSLPLLAFLFLRFYLFDSKRAQAGGTKEGERQSDSQLSRVQSQDPRIMTRAEGRHLTS